MSLRFMRLEDRIVLDGAAAVIIAAAASSPSGTPSNASSASSGGSKGDPGHGSSSGTKGDSGQGASSPAKSDAGQSYASGAKGDSGQGAASGAKGDSGQSSTAAKSDGGQGASSQPQSSSSPDGVSKPADSSSISSKPGDAAHVAAASSSSGGGHGDNSHDASSGSDAPNAADAAADKSHAVAAKTAKDAGHDPQGPSSSAIGTDGKAQAGGQASAPASDSSSGGAASATARATHWEASGDSGKSASDSASPTHAQVSGTDKNASPAQGAGDQSGYAARASSADSAAAARSSGALTPTDAARTPANADKTVSRQSPAVSTDSAWSGSRSSHSASDTAGGANGPASNSDYVRNLLNAVNDSHRNQGATSVGGSDTRDGAQPAKGADVNPDSQPQNFWKTAAFQIDRVGQADLSSRGAGLGAMSMGLLKSVQELSGMNAAAAANVPGGPASIKAARQTQAAELKTGASMRLGNAAQTTTPAQPVRVIAISSAVQGAQALASDVARGVIAVVYDETDTPRQVLAQITQALDGQKAQSIAIASHENSTGAFDLTDGNAVSAGSVLADSQMNSFWQGVGGLLTANGTIDILACDQASTVQGEMTVAAIAQVSGHAVDASSDATGNASSGGNWVLEQGNVNVATTYFNPGKLGNFSGTLADPGVQNPSVSGATPALGAEITSMAVAANGQIVVAGYAFNSATHADDFVVERFNAGGVLDSTFGTNGLTLTDFGGENAEAFSVAIQSDGKIVAAGEVFNGANYDFALARYNANGSLDATFGAGGKVVTDFSGQNAVINSIAIEGSGVSTEIVAGGYISAGSHTDMALARYTTSGSLDTGFGGGGVATQDIAGRDAQITSVAVVNSGGANQILAAGFGYDAAAGHNDFVLAQYKDNGALNAGFGANGLTLTDFGAEAKASSLAVGPNGQIVVAGQADAGAGHASEFALARYSANGGLDTTFGNAGTVATAVGYGASQATSVTIEGAGPSARIVAAGVATDSAGNTDFALAAYNADGSVAGEIVQDFLGNGSQARAVAYDAANSDLVLAGFTSNGAGPEFALAGFVASGGLVTGGLDAGFGLSGLQTLNVSALIDTSGAPVRVMAVASDIENAGLLASDTSDGVINFIYNETGAPAQILQELELALGGVKADSIGIATHGIDDGQFVLTSADTVNASTVLGDPAEKTFWSGVGGQLKTTGAIDLLPCSLAVDAKGQITAAAIAAVAGRTVNASTDATGNPAAGGNWILEQGNVDLTTRYFAPGKIGNYGGLLQGQQSTNLSTMNTSITGAFAGDATSGDNFGYSVAIDGGFAVVGAPDHKVSQHSSQGAAYVFAFTSSSWFELAELTGSDGGCGDSFGSSVAISGNNVVVGAPDHQVGANALQGAAYVFVLANGTPTGTNAGGRIFNENYELAASDGQAWDKFGSSVAVSGNNVVVGAPWRGSGQNSQQGAAYVFILNPSSGQPTGCHASGYIYNENYELAASDGAHYANFGASVAISGNNVLVGGPGHNSAQGAAYVFVLNSSGGQPTGSHVSGDIYSENYELTASDGSAHDNFGASVAIDGDLAVLGASGHKVGQNSAQGAAYVFDLNASGLPTGSHAGGDSYNENYELIASDGRTGDNFGASLAISGDNVIVGAPLHQVGAHALQGAAYIFTLDSTGLPLSGNPSGDGRTFTQNYELVAAGGAWGDHYGASVAISGSAVIAGAPSRQVGVNANQGAAFIGALPQGQTTLGASSASLDGPASGDGAANDNFGYSVAIDGGVAVVGATWHAVGLNSAQGAAYVFAVTSSSWFETAELTSSDGLADDYFGSSVAISGNNIVVGAPNHNSYQGAAYVYVLSNGVPTGTDAGGHIYHENYALTASDGQPGQFASGDLFGISVAVSGNNVVVGAQNHLATNFSSAQGAAYVFNIASYGLTRAHTQSYELGASDEQPGDLFGASVAISGNNILVGAPGHQVGANPCQGAAYVFVLNPSGAPGNGQRSDLVYIEHCELTAADGKASDTFGSSVAISGNNAVAGALWHKVSANSTQGAAYVFVLDSSGTPTNLTQPGSQNDAQNIYNENYELLASDGRTGDRFGVSVAVSGDNVVVGAMFRQVSANSSQGTAYVYLLDSSGKPTGGNPGSDNHTFTQNYELTASGGSAYDRFGYSVAISGDIILAGAPNHQVDGHADQGAAYFSALPQTMIASVSGTSAQLSGGVNGDGGIDGFGYSVAIDGDLAVVGAPGHKVGPHSNQGAAYLFSVSSTAWYELAELTASDGSSGDYFGSSLAISGNDVVVGAPSRNASQGAAYVYVLSYGMPTTTDVGGHMYHENFELNASDGYSGDQFGISVAVSGASVVAGAPGHNSLSSGQGAAYVFNLSAPNAAGTNSGGKSIYHENYELGASDGLNQLKGAFGASVGISGNTVVVGAPGNNSNTGVAYVFQLSGGAPTHGTRIDGLYVENYQLSSSDRGTGDNFGASVAISGDNIVIGAPNHAFAYSTTQPSAHIFGLGEAYVFHLNAGTPTGNQDGQTYYENAILTPSDGQIFQTGVHLGDQFGASVAISGNNVVVGSPRHTVGPFSSTGAAYVFVLDSSGMPTTAFDSAAHIYTEDHYLVAASPMSGDTQYNSGFAMGVAISGDIALLGEPGRMGTGVAAAFDVSGGSPYKPGEKYEMTSYPIAQTLGASLAVSGDLAVVGASYYSSDGSFHPGMAYVFAYSSGSWSEKAELVGSDEAVGDKFAYSLAIDGNEVIVGAPGHNSSTGAAYIFELDANGLPTGVRVNGDLYNENYEISASGGQVGDLFGTSVAISGSNAVVGAPGCGAAYLFSHAGSAWTQEATLTASDGGQSGYFGASVAISGNNIVVGAPNMAQFAGEAYLYNISNHTPGAYTEDYQLVASDGHLKDYFGTSVAVSGNTVVVGAPGHAHSRGAAYVYLLDSTGFPSGGPMGDPQYVENYQLVASDGQAASDGPGDAFGASVAISGNNVLIGAPSRTEGSNTAQGAAYLFTLDSAGKPTGNHSLFAYYENSELATPGGNAFDSFGSAVAITADHLLVGAMYRNASQGAAYVYDLSYTRYSSSPIAETSQLNTGPAAPHYGTSVAISGDYAVVGATYQGNSSGHAGEAYLFEYTSGAWTEKAELAASDGLAADLFGASLAIDGNDVIVGAPAHNSSQGAAYVFVLDSGGRPTGARLGGDVYLENYELLASDGQKWDNFGGSVAISGNNAVVGAMYHRVGSSSSQGAAYVFVLDSGGRPTNATQPGTQNTAHTAYNENFELLASDGQAYDYFGSSVAVSGNTVVVGAPGRNNSSGEAYMYNITGYAAGSHFENYELFAHNPSAYDSFGASVAISGTTVVVGAPGRMVTYSNQGAVYVFNMTHCGSIGPYTESYELVASDGQLGANFGDSVAISGRNIVVGAPDQPAGSTPDVGAAYLFVLDSNSAPTGNNPGSDNHTYTENLELQTSGSPGDHFGAGVAISGNNVLAGAPNCNSNQGAATLFHVSSYASASTPYSETYQLTADSAATRFGGSVAISGNYAVVSESISGSLASGRLGVVSLFEYSCGSWTEKAELSASDGGPNDCFGLSLAVDGDEVIVGAPYHTVGQDTYQGEAYVFLLDCSGLPTGAHLSGDMYNENYILTASDGASGDNFGVGVAISGNNAVVGAPGHAAGKGEAYIFNLSNYNSGTHGYTEDYTLYALGGAAQDQFGVSVAISGDTIVVGAPGNNTHAGRAYVFNFSNYISCSHVNTQTYELISSDRNSPDFFGASVAISGSNIVVGAPGHQVGGNTFQGAAYVFTLDSSTGAPAGSPTTGGSGYPVYLENYELQAMFGAAGDEFGQRVAISGLNIVVGAPDRNNSHGAAYIYTLDATGKPTGANPSSDNHTYTENFGLNPSGGLLNGDNFGAGVAISGYNIVVGAPGRAVGSVANQGLAFFGGLAPSLSGALSTLNISETQTPALFSGLSITDAPGNKETVTVMINSPLSGDFTAASLSASGFQGCGDGFYYLNNVSIADAQADLRELVFVPTGHLNPGGTVTTDFSIYVANANASATMPVTVTTTDLAAAASRPIPSTTQASIPSASATAATTTGLAVNTIISGLFTTPYQGLSGIAVVGNTADAGSQGTWQYNYNNQGWQDIPSGTLSATNAAMISSNTLLRFSPAPGFNGTAPALSLLAVDCSYPSGSQYWSDAIVTQNTANPTAGSSLAFSSTPVSLAVTVGATTTTTTTTTSTTQNSIPPAPEPAPATTLPPAPEPTPAPPTTPTTTTTTTVNPVVTNASTNSATNFTILASTSGMGTSAQTSLVATGGMADVTGLTATSSSTLSASLTTGMESQTSLAFNSVFSANPTTGTLSQMAAVSQTLSTSTTTTAQGPGQTLVLTAEAAKTLDAASQTTSAVDKAIAAKDIADTAKALSGGDRVQETKVTEVMTAVSRDVDKAVQQKGDTASAKAGIESSVVKAAAAKGITDPVVVKGMQASAVKMFTQERAANSRILLETMIPKKN